MGNYSKKMGSKSIALKAIFAILIHSSSALKV